MVSLAEAMMLSGGYKNAILIDYKDLCCNYFTLSGVIVPNMGTFIANLIVSMGLNPNLVDMVGHSLGAQICAYVGMSLLERQLGQLNTIFGESIFSKLSMEPLMIFGNLCI